MSAADFFPSPGRRWLSGETDAAARRWQHGGRSDTADVAVPERAAEPERVGSSVAVRAILGGLSAIAAVLSGYLAWSAYTSSPVAGCSGGAIFDCGHVLNSRWSKVAGVPVSVPALLTHVAILGLVLARPVSLRWQYRRWAAVGLAVMTAAAAAVWFLAVQIFWVQQLCVYCIAAHGCALCAAGVLWWSRPLRRSTAAGTGGLAAVAVGVLATLQSTAAAPATFEVIEHEKPAAVGPSEEGPAVESDSAGGAEAGLFEAPAAVSGSPQVRADVPQQPDHRLLAAPPWSALAAAAVSPATLLTAQVGGGTPAAGGTSAQSARSAEPDAPRVISILDDIRLNPKHWPIVGDPEAELIFAELLDYTCPHCRNTHRAIKGAQQRYGDRLAVLVLPVPMERQCNPTVQSTNAQHSEACELARLAIAVWRVDPEQFERFHDYLFDAQPSYARAEAQAQQLVDAEKLQEELSSSVPDDYISKHVALYRRAGTGAIPKLMFPGATTVGEVGSTDALIQMIEQRLVR